jgi:hypothetical protein
MVPNGGVKLARENARTDNYTMAAARLRSAAAAAPNQFISEINWWPAKSIDLS